MKRIYLKLLDDRPSPGSEDLRLADVTKAVEAVLAIQWEIRPRMEAKGGYAMAGMIPEKLDLEAALQKLKQRGYIGVM